MPLAGLEGIAKLERELTTWCLEHGSHCVHLRFHGVKVRTFLAQGLIMRPP